MMKSLLMALLTALLVTSPSVEAQTTLPDNTILAKSWQPECQCYRRILWGPETWFDATYPATFVQDFDFWPVSRTATNQPLIIWTHPGGGVKHIPAESNPADPTLYDRIIVPARAAGFAVASIEYRHPVHNDDIVPPPHWDIGLAVQSLRNMAADLGIDPNNVFLIGGSQGTLNIWQAQQADMQVPGATGAAGQSSLVNAVYAYNGQATYRGKENATWFLVPEDRKEFVVDWRRQHPQDALFGSAASSVHRNSPPAMLKYEFPFYRRLVTFEEAVKHHPDAGLKLCDAYKKAGIPKRCQTFDNIPKEDDYKGFVEFFQKYLKPPQAQAQ
ncbi:MAG: hypothetical protein C4K60_04770 [Ideonella sp. MAG2]|nr:MAG: hypothetical protein C4K60_04770 [Ideonella sp. MAG2]